MRVIILIFMLILSCGGGRKDDSSEKMLFNYLTFCTGGSKEACTNVCSENTCGVAVGGSVTPENLDCVNSCISTCSSNCDLTGLFLIYMEE